jgi:hypothetical protein
VIGNLYKVCGEIRQLFSPKMRQFSFAQIIQAFCPVVRIGSPTPCPSSECPRLQGGRHTRFCCGGRDQFGRLEWKPSTMYSLCSFGINQYCMLAMLVLTSSLLWQHYSFYFCNNIVSATSFIELLIFKKLCILTHLYKLRRLILNPNSHGKKDYLPELNIQEGERSKSYNDGRLSENISI